MLPGRRSPSLRRRPSGKWCWDVVRNEAESRSRLDNHVYFSPKFLPRILDVWLGARIGDRPRMSPNRFSLWARTRWRMGMIWRVVPIAEKSLILMIWRSEVERLREQRSPEIMTTDTNYYDYPQIHNPHAVMIWIPNVLGSGIRNVIFVWYSKRNLVPDNSVLFFHLNIQIQ